MEKDFFTKHYRNYQVEERDGKLYATYKGHEFGPYDEEEQLTKEMKKNIKFVLNAEYGKTAIVEFGQLDEFSKWAQERTVECMEAAQREAADGMGREQYYHGMVDALAEAELALKQVKLGHNHECYWKDRYDLFQRLVDDWVPVDLKEQIKKKMR